MGYINKNIFQNYLSCPYLGWFSKRNKISRLSGLNNDLLVLEGKNIHKMAWKLYPEAVFVKRSEDKSLDETTQDIIKDNSIKTIIDATFRVDGFSVRTDILERFNDGTWGLIQIKSGSKYKLKYVFDLAFIGTVLLRAGIIISKASIMHVRGDYRLGMPASQLFRYLDLTDKVGDVMLDYMDIFDSASKVLESEEMPQPAFRRTCKNCPLFEECTGKDIVNTIFDLPRLSVPAMEELVLKGIQTIDKVPLDFELTEAQRMVKTAVDTNTTFISGDLKAKMDALEAPYYYLDFESITAILPIYPDIAPHSQMLTQFSIHKCAVIDKIDEHFEYIADPKFNCQEIIAKELIKYLGDTGSIITYANFEKVAIQRLAGLYPDLSEKLLAIAARIVDFEELVRKNYYDIKFHGHSSIKVILPIMFENMNYDGLEINAGGDAAAAFAFMAMGVYDEAQCEETKKNLLKYCAQDTLALVKIHKFLVDAVQ